MIAAPFANIEVLFVEDELPIARSMCTNLQTLQYAPTPAHSAESAIDITSRKQFNVLATDIRLSKIDGLNLAKQLRAKDACIAIVFITGKPDSKGMQVAQQLGAVQYISKPVSIADLGENMAIAARWNIAQLIGRCASRYISGRRDTAQVLESKMQRAKVELKNIALHKRDAALFRDLAYSKSPGTTELYHLLEAKLGHYLGKA